MKPIVELVREHLDEQAKAFREEAERYNAEWEALPEEEKERILERFTRPDGTLAESWWEPDFW